MIPLILAWFRTVPKGFVPVPYRFRSCSVPHQTACWNKTERCSIFPGGGASPLPPAPSAVTKAGLGVVSETLGAFGVGVPRESFVGLSGSFGGSLGILWWSLGVFGEPLGSSGAPLGILWSPLGFFGGRLGDLWRSFGILWGSLGVLGGLLGVAQLAWPRQRKLLSYFQVYRWTVAVLFSRRRWWLFYLKADCCSVVIFL